MVYVPPTTPYRTLFAAFLAKKHRLAVDAWGADTSAVDHVYAPLIAHIAAEVREKDQMLYPWPVWKMQDRVGRLARTIPVSEYLVREWADHFVGKSEKEIIDIAGSFKFESCVHREGLNEILRENASLVTKDPESK